jgi:hypothetical protein
VEGLIHYDRHRRAGLRAALPEPSRPAMVNPDEFDGFLVDFTDLD